MEFEAVVAMGVMVSLGVRDAGVGRAVLPRWRADARRAPVAGRGLSDAVVRTRRVAGE